MVACADNCKECLTATDRKCDLDMCDDYYGYNPITETCNGKYTYTDLIANTTIHVHDLRRHSIQL